MKQEDRERIGRALLRGVEDLPAEIRKDLEECGAEDVRVIEPIIDEIVAREAFHAAELALELSSQLEDD